MPSLLSAFLSLFALTAAVPPPPPYTPSTAIFPREDLPVSAFLCSSSESPAGACCLTNETDIFTPFYCKAATGAGEAYLCPTTSDSTPVSTWCCSAVVHEAKDGSYIAWCEKPQKAELVTESIDTSSLDASQLKSLMGGTMTDTSGETGEVNSAVASVITETDASDVAVRALSIIERVS